MGNEYRIELLSDYPEYIPQVAKLVAYSFRGPNTTDPIAYAERRTDEDKKAVLKEWEVWHITRLNLLKKRKQLHLSLIVFDCKTNKLVTVALCNDAKNAKMEMSDTEFDALKIKMPVFGRSLEGPFIHKLGADGYNKFWLKNKIDINDKKQTEALNTYFHVFMRAIAREYAGRGVVSRMYPIILEFARKNGFKYVVHETSNPRTQHICRKHGNAITYHEAKISENFDDWNHSGLIGKDDALMFQVIHL